MRILLVEDDPTAAQLTSWFLEKDGHAVTTAASGEDALGALRGSLPELVLLDIGLPDMDGYDVLRTMREDDRTRGIPTVFLTGENDAQSRDKAEELGAAGLLTKPFEPGTLSARIEGILERHKNQRK